MKTRLPVVLALVAQLATGALAQQPQPSPTPLPVEQQKPQPESDDVVRITTNLVQVDAVVTDKQGKLVTDLQPEEIEIFEDGRKQKITHFSYNGAEAFTGKETQFNPGQQTDMQRLVAVGAIKLGTDLNPGDYVIQIVVTDLLADQRHRVSTQWMDFQVLK